MNVKRFVAADMRRALELVKQEMGDDAIILSSKRVKAGVEILTSNDAPFEELRLASQRPDSHASYGAPNPYNLSTTPQSNSQQNRSSRYFPSEEHYADDVAMHSDDAWSWDNVVKQKPLARPQQDPTQRGMASGKTQQQLAAEIDAARRKMEAADNIPFNQQRTSQGGNNQQEFTRQPTSAPGQVVKTSVSNTSIRPSLQDNLVANRARASEQIKQEYSEPRYSQPRYSEPRDSEPRHTEQQLAAKDSRSSLEDRIEPQISNEIYEDVGAETGNRIQPEIGFEQGYLSTISSPFSSPSYTWTGPQSFTDFISYPIVDEPVELIEDIDDDECFEDDNNQDWQWQELKSEISDMREMLHVQLERLGKAEDSNKDNGSNPVSLSAAIKATILKRLINLGLKEKAAEKILTPLKVKHGLAETWTEVLAKLAHQVPIWGQDVISRGGIYSFVGPSGAGKTSIVSKLATRAVLERGPNSISIITLDAQSSSKQQLERLGKILGVAVYCACDRVSITRALADRCNDHLILIDTPSLRGKAIDALSAESQSTIETLKRLPQVENMLVLPANGQEKLLQASIEKYSILQPIACVLTKLDECLSLGESLNVLMEKNLPVAYSCNGAKIPKHIERARGHQLITKAVALLKKDQNHQQQQKNIQNIAFQQKYQSGQQFNQQSMSA